MSQTGVVTRPLAHSCKSNQIHAHIAYRFVHPTSTSSLPPKDNNKDNKSNTTLLYLPGLQSTWSGLKGQTLETTASELGLNYLSLNYQGHGTSSGIIKEILSLEEWLLDIEAVLLKTLSTAKVPSSSNLIIVGSSLGGWLALLLSLFLTKPQLPQIRGLILIAPAVNASHRWSNTADHMNNAASVVSIPSEYADQGCIQLNRHLIKDANERWCILMQPQQQQQHFPAAPSPSCGEGNSLAYLLKHKLIDTTLIIDILAGALDSVVPFATAEALAGTLPGSNLHIVENGDHRLSSSSDLELLVDIVERQVESILSVPVPEGQATTFDGLIKQKFLAAASEITYHIEERSPDPTESQLVDLETKLDYTFKERDLLRLALTHKSAAAPSSTTFSWLGDSILQLIISSQLAASEGYASSGRLTELRSLLASREHFAECCVQIGLDKMLIAGKGMTVENEKLDRKLSVGVLGELFEAVLGAVFVDGGMVAARHAYVKNFPLEQELKRMKKEQI
ncbi:hypothetical protein Ndes2526B_g01289 [Nannochloris sp. 'desiccata']